MQRSSFFPFPFLILFILLSTTHTYLSPVQEHLASVIHVNSQVQASNQATKTKLFIPEVQKSAAELDDGVNIMRQLCGLQTPPDTCAMTEASFIEFR